MAADAHVRNPTQIKALGPKATAEVGVRNPTQIRASQPTPYVHVKNPTVLKASAGVAEYLAPPGHRMLWDADGTRMRKYTAAAWSEYDFAAIIDLNDEEAATSIADTVATATSYVVYFPERRDLNGIFASFAPAVPGDEVTVTVQTSADTTNGVNGTWTTRVAASTLSAGPWGADPADYRGPENVVAGGIRAVRFLMEAEVAGSGWTLRSLHFYGSITAGENPHRLQLWHPTLDQPVAADHFDWKRSPRGSSSDKQFRIKNLSPSQRASTVSVYVDALTDTYPSVAYQHYLSMGGTFSSMLTVPAIEPGKISPVVTLRRVTPSEAVLGAWACRVRAVPSWF